MNANNISMKQNILVRHPADLTVGWAQRVISRNLPDVIVSGVDIRSVDTGTTTRVRLEVEHDGPPDLPRQWFVKLPSLAWRARLVTALPRLLHTEVRFYNEAARGVPIAMPGVLAAQSAPGRGAILVLADVSESGAMAGQPGDVLSDAQAALVVRRLARLHARFWNKADFMQAYQWLAGPVRRLEDRLGTALAVPLMRRGLRCAGQLVPKKLHRLAVRYARQRARAMRFLSTAPLTLVHHDCHPGNLFWDGTKPGLLDWQLVRFGEGISDVAYFLATSLAPETRRNHETRLVATYVRELQDNGITGIELGDLLQRYRAHLAYPFEAMVVSLAVGGMMKLENNYELIRRTAAAVEDLDAFNALPI
jgi:thiamine kinase-like enzyme